MKKLLLSIVSLTTLGLMAQLDVTGTWVFKPVAYAMAVGQKGDYSDWGNPAEEVTGARACQFDDEFVISEDGTFKNVFGDETFLEGWQGGTWGCGAPIAPFDGSAEATWSLDESNNNLTIYGKGAFIGIPKVINMNEISSNDDAADSITYMVNVIADTMILEIQIKDDGTHWKFELVRKREAINPVGVWRFAPKAYAMAVGQKGDYSDWGNPAEEVTGARACQFDDDFVFMADGTFKNVFGDETFLEGWQGGTWGCGAPIAPFDGSAEATWSLDESNNNLTIYGKGAFIGIPKVINMNEISSNDDAADSITYMVSVTADTMIFEIQIKDDGTHWKFELVKQADNSMANRAIQVGSLKVYPNPVNDMIFVTGVNAKSVINIRDFSGKVINRINGVNAMGGINVSNLKTGAYLIEMTNNKNVQTAKFIKN